MSQWLWVGLLVLSVSETADMGFFSHNGLSQHGMKNKNLPWVALLWTEVLMRGQRRMSKLIRAKGYSNSYNHFVQLWWAERHLSTSNLETNGLQQDNTTPGFFSVGQEEKWEAAADTDPSTRDRYGLENADWSDTLGFVLRRADGRIRILCQWIHQPNLTLFHYPRLLLVV